jgi:type II secretory pathway pseudopilin PulG
MHKRGDTLIEVALAIGIFSLVAVAVVSVVSGSTSNAQSALELTLTREEIDAQAEAIRFIQTSYIAGGNVNIQGNTKYKVLWDEIVKKHAIVLSDTSDTVSNEILKYNPSTCEEIYKGDNLFDQKAFIINTRNLGLEYDDEDKTFAEKIIISPSKDKDNVFTQAVTYPRMLYNDEEDTLLDRNSTADLAAVEGIYVVAVRDPDTTTIVQNSGVDDKKAAYYDFYIRTCWFAPGAKLPSTISTVIRLQDPSTINYN